MSDPLKSLKTNEQPWANRSGRSEEMSNVSKLLISLTKNERMSDSLKKIWLKKSKILFYYVLFQVKKKNSEKMSELLILAHFLFFGERCEQIAHFAHQK